MTDIIDWSQFRPALLSPTQAFNEAASPDAGASAGNQESPSSFDRALGLSAVLGLAIAGAVSIFYLSYRVAEFLFGV